MTASVNGPLDDIDSRLRWARDHIQEVDNEIRSFLNDGPMYEVGVEAQPDGLTYIYVAHTLRELSPDLRFKVGDCLHNLRASLDNIAYGLVSTYRKPDGNISFPVCLTDTLFRDKALPYFAGIDQGAIDIIESVQPYKDPNGVDANWLRTLNRRWNIDKHRVPTLVGMIPGPFSYLESDGDLADYAIYTDQGLKDGMAVGHVRYKSRQHTRRQPHFSFEIAIDESWSPTIWRSIPDALHSTYDLITHERYGVLARLRPFFH